MSTNNLFQQLQEMCQGTTYEIIYDTDVQGWENQKFYKCVLYKKNITIINHSKEQTIFGCHYHQPILRQEWTTDSELVCFLINQKENTIQHYHQKNCKSGILCQSQSRFLYGCHGCFGIQSTPNRPGSSIWEQLTRYYGIMNIFTKNNQFETTRVIVLRWE
ncbi:hypothetical protein QTN25_004656 [Entamoeba marina]